MSGYNSLNYTEQGGSRGVIGGSLDVVSGGEIDIEAGGALKIAGTAVTSSAAELNQLHGLAVGAGAIVLNTTGAAAIDAASNGKTYVATKADGATTFTLPAPAAGLAGVRVRFVQTANQNLVIDGTADKMVVFGGDGTSKTATFSTLNELIGAGAEAICTGTMWVVTGMGKATISVA
jgi:hypothetical protein